MGKRKKATAEAESRSVSLADKKPKTRIDAAKSRQKGIQKNSRDTRHTVKDMDKGDTSISTASPPITSAQSSSSSPIATVASASTDPGMNGDRQIGGLKAVVAFPKLLPRSLMATGFVPRQVARAKVPSSAGGRVINRSSSGSPAASGISKSISSVAASPSPAIASTVSSAPGSATESRPIFRAKDIIKQWVPTPSDSLSPPSKAKQGGRTGTGPVRLRMFERDQNDSSETISSTRTTKPNTWTVTSMEGQSSATSSGRTSATRTTTTTSDNIIHAQPIVVYLERRPHRKEYPYGNYPYYYEKRVEEQSTKKADSISPSSTAAAAAAAAAASQSAGEQQKQQQKQQQRFWITKSSVLFPRRSDPEEERMPLQELAKKVDLRLEFLDPSWFRGKRVVDIGCNAALLTVFIAMHYKPRKIQGVDIDPSLIGKAQNFILKTFSQISPQAYTQTRGGSGNNESSTVEEEEEEEEEEDVPYEEYFPKSMHRIHGFLPVPKRTLRTEVLFPHNIELRVTDWVTETEDQQDTGAEQWDVILGFSLAKWVHLHHGDTGMKRFFQKVYRSLAPGGIFLLEPQAFETYNRRSKLTPVMQENYKAMTFKPQNFQEYLLSDKVGFREAMHLGHSEGGAKNFNRDIFLYRK